MQLSIQTILQDLQSGAITKAQAKLAIQQLRSSQGSEGLLFAVPRWTSATDPSRSLPVDLASHAVLLGDFPALDTKDVERHLAGCRCSRLQDAGSGPAEVYRTTALECFEQVQRILKSKPRKDVLLQILLPDDESGRLAFGLAGMFRTASMEDPHFHARVVLAPQGSTKDSLLGLLETELGDAVSCMKLEDGRLRTLAWEEAEARGESFLPYREDGVYLITGGLGRLGTHFATDILRQTRRAKVILTGRSPLSAAIRSHLDALGDEAGRVDYLAIDLADLPGLESAMAGITRKYGRLSGVMHAAGCIRDNFITKKPREEFLEVLAPKVAGTWNLDLATRDADLDFFALFSSGASVLGNAGQCDYAAANGFLDQFAALRAVLVEGRLRRGKSLSINWPLWKNGGFQLGETETRQLAETFGMEPLETPVGLSSFARCLGFAESQAVVVSGDLGRLRSRLFPESVGKPPAPPSKTPMKMADAIQGGEDRIAWTVNFLRREFAAVVGVGYEDMDPSAALEKYGINSILAMDLTNKLETAFGPLPKTLFFEYQTIQELAAYFAEAHAEDVRLLSAPQSTVATDRSKTPAPPARIGGATARPLRRISRPGQPPAPVADPGTSDRIAIVGLSGRYPESNDLIEFWKNLSDGKDCVTEVPPERWDWKEFYSADRTQAGRHYSRWGGFISGADEFDSRFFSISIKEAENLDPQERLFLQHAWAALEDAGYTRSALRNASAPNGTGSGADVGVYVGVMYSDYQLFGVGGTDADGNPLPIGASYASIANRVSYFLDLHGPSLSLDTMCSSSLSAIHLACQDLRAGRTGMAIAGGVNLTLHPHKYLVLSNGQFISSHGHCQSFGEGGDGYIPGEGVGVVVLKRLSDALRDGDQVHGIIRGSALNHGGKTNGYSVPNPVAQSQVIRMAMRQAGVDPHQISYVEAHGTGTKLGDPIEIAALTKVFQESSRDTGYCRIGSVKSNIGHCESAAGIAGLTKVLLQMRHKQIAPSLHSQRLNPNIDFTATPFVVNQTLKPWERPCVDGIEQPRLAALSSFGAGGSNAHLIIEEFDPASPAGDGDEAGPAVIPLSARTEEQLRQRAIDLAGFLDASTASATLGELAHTLQVGREAMDKRLAILAKSREQLRDLLLRFADGETGMDGLFHAKQKADKDTLALFTADADLRATLHKWIGERKYGKVLELWVKGLDLDWDHFHEGRKPRKISLPTYPFAKERCWFRGGRRPKPSQMSTPQSAIHPFLHRNTSSFGRQTYASNFPESGAHLPLVLLEMAAAASRDAFGKEATSTPILISEVLWGEMPPIDPSAPIQIELSQAGELEVEFEIYHETQGEELVICQGRGTLQAGATPRPLDLESLRATGCLVPSNPANEVADLGPILLHEALDAFSRRQGIEMPLSFTALEAARLYAPVAPGSQVWVRPSDSPSLDGTRVDLDVIDGTGKVSVAIRGLACCGVTIIERSADTGISPSIAAIHHVSLGDSCSDAEEPTASTASTGIRLVTLSDLSTDASPAPAPAVREDEGGIFILSIPELGGTYPDFDSLIGNTVACLEELASHASLKVLRIEWEGPALPGLQQDAWKVMDRRRLGEAMLAFPFPIVARLRGDAVGAGFLWAAYSDLPVFNASASYGVNGLLPAWNPRRYLQARFGRAFADRILQAPLPVPGGELRQMGLTAAILPPAEQQTFAEALALALSEKPRESLRVLKQHLSRDWLSAHREAIGSAGSAAKPLPVAIAPECSVEELSLPIPCERLEHGAVLLRTNDLCAACGGEQLIPFLRGIVSGIARRPDIRSIVFESDCSAFFPGWDESMAASQGDEFRNLIEECPLPVVASLRVGIDGPGFLLSLLCDHVVWNEQEIYGCGNAAAADAYASAWTVLASRFGEEPARGLLLARQSFAGRQLADLSAFGCAAADSLRCEALAQVEKRIAVHSETMRPSMHPSSSEVLEASLEAQSPGGVEELPPNSVVRMEDLGNGVISVAMEDRESKNMFSPLLVEELTKAFSRINRLDSCRAVILTGCETFFASGGTKETLLGIQHGESKFTDSEAFKLAAECRVPVVAAMQGHAIGAGWVLGLLADFVLFSEESRYRSPYMTFGFTPGAGATLVLPARLGEDLACEGLFTGREYSGRELGARNPWIRIEPRARIMETARSLAARIAELPLERLIELKRLWSVPFGERLREVCQLELEMHDQTLVGNTQALQRIEAAFPTSSIAPQPAGTPGVPAPTMDAVLDKLRSFLAGELLIGEDEIEEDTEFVDLGLDSVTGVTWIRKINAAYGTSIEATKIYSHPTLGKLARYVSEQLGRSPEQAIPEPPPQAPASSPAPAPKNPTPTRHALPPRMLASVRKRWNAARERRTSADAMKDPIAVIGMSGQFPQARNTEIFWKNLAEGKNCITEVDQVRWDLGQFFEAGRPKQGKTYSKWLGALEAFDRFDPMFFNLSPIEAEIMDPQQRLFLQSSWHAIEDAGYNPQSLSGSRCGVFVGCASSDYHQASREHELSAHGFTGSATSILAARISYFLNLRGPCLAIETACSSSLVAIATACDSLNAGTSDLALAGGVYVMTGSGLHVKTSQTGMLSPDGRCFTFDQRANGFVPGEAVGAILLKRLSDAQKDGDVILGVIRGWGVNQDGKTNGITAPNAEAQRQLELDVYARFGIDPSEIQLVEAHGTGTKLGDPIEIEALKESFRAHTRREGYCAIGSVKSNIGHCLTAAGIAGFIKVLLALRHKQLPPTINFKDLNEHIDLRNSPFFVNTALTPWEVPAGQTRHAAISSFGFSGTNAHLVVSQGPDPLESQKPAPEIGAGPEFLIPFSARSEDRLERKVADFLEFLDREGEIPLRSMAYVLQVGREPMEHRVAFLADSTADLRDRMRGWLGTRDSGIGTYAGDARRTGTRLEGLPRDRAARDAMIEGLLQQGRLHQIAELWANGLQVEWSRMYGQAKPSKVRLPLYPFSEERYWLATSAPPLVAPPMTGLSDSAGGTHPLLHRKTEDLLLQARTPWLAQDGAIASVGRESADGSERAPVQRIPLPTYPFAQDRCWPERDDRVEKVSSPTAAGDEAIEQLLEQIERQSIGSRDAARLLRDLP